MDNKTVNCFLIGVVFILLSLRINAQEVADIRYTVDEELPVVHCINGLGLNFTADHRERTITAREINLGSTDNIGIKELKLTKHHPIAKRPEDGATDQITFTANDSGKHKIDLWVGDFGGNWARKSTYIVVSDLALKKEPATSNIKAINYPNPFSEQTSINFEMIDSGKANIAFLDSKGNLIKEIKSVYPKGEQIVEINKNDLPGPGIYYYQITTEQGSIIKNMIMVNY